MNEPINLVSQDDSSRERASQVDFEFRIGRAKHRIFFRTSDCELKRTNEARVAASLLPCMKTGNVCSVNGLLSQRLIGAVDSIQDLFTTWLPELSRVSVKHWSARKNKKVIGADRVGAFFSGGVDSFYTLLKHRDEITDLIFLHGFDMGLEEVSIRQKTAAALQEAAAAFGKNLIQVETNLRSLTDRYVSWEYAHGAALATIGHLHAGFISKIYIPASFSHANLFPWGSHPELDKLWSSEALEFVHDGGEATRVQKVKIISENDIALKSLRVCWKNPDGAYNCGECEKCLRTMINLRLAGTLDRCTTFPRSIDLGKVRGIVASKESARVFIRENLKALEETQTCPEVAEALRGVLSNTRGS